MFQFILNFYNYSQLIYSVYHYLQIYNERKESDIYTEKQRVTPKQGRVVLFDGSHYHTAQQCTNKIRCIVNYNLG